MGNIAGFIRKRPILSFFFITFAITWGLGFSYDAVLNRESLVLVPLVSIATCGPSIAGIIVTSLCANKEKLGKRRSRWVAFVVALILSTLVFAANNTIVERNEFSAETLAAIAVLFTPPVSFVISAAFSRRTAVKKYLASLIKIRGVVWWSVLAAVFVPSLVFISVVISSLISGQPLSQSGNSTFGVSLIGMVTVRFLYQLFFFNVIGEEAGWSGFARAHLQKRFSPLVTAFIVALFWGPWHLFLWYAEGQVVTSIEFWFDAYLYVIPLSIIFGWFYNRSKGSILVAGIAHAAGNTAIAFIPNVDLRAASVVALLASVVVVIVDRMWMKLPQGCVEKHTI